MARGELSVAILGLGSRGLSVLERIVTLARMGEPAAVRVEVIDPHCDGAGVHAASQPDYLLLNTTCGQVSMFPDAWSVGDGVDVTGPNLYEWVTDAGLRLADDGFTVGTTGRAIEPHDFLPRRLLGEYLGWFLADVLRRAPSSVTVNLHRAEATDLSDDLVVTTSTGESVQVDYAFLTTGYTPGGAATGPGRYVGTPYPLPAAVDGVQPGQTVAIGGFGLSAMDVMSAFTVGRGGRFVAGAAGLEYEPSGREPRLLFFSRSGVPCRARPQVVRFGPPYQPLVFTPASVDAVRAERGGPLDFETDVLPLVLAEIRIAHRRCQASADPFAGVDGVDDVMALLDELDTRHGPFDAAATFDGGTDMLLDNTDAYRKWLAEVLRGDLADGLLGFTGSPVKAGLDILRALRDTFRYVVDYGGLTGPSLDRFLGHTVPVINRAVVGPQYERHLELLALFAAGVADAPFGPAPSVHWDGEAWTITSTALGTPRSERADWLVAAQVPMPAVENSGSSLLTAMARRGTIRRHPPASATVPGLEVDSGQHPVGAAGQPDRRLWVLGPLCEGSTFYNNLVPSPQMWSRPVFDAHRCVTAMYQDAGVSVPATGPAGRPSHPIDRP